MTQLQALIFDVDGTLADTERDGHRVAFNRAFVDAGLPWEWSIERYGELLTTTGGKERLRRYLQESHPEILAQPDVDELIKTLHKTKTHHYTTLVQSGMMPLRPGVKRLIQEARQQQLPIAIATTTTPENVTALLKTTLGSDSLNWFAVIAAGDVVPAKKPAPDIFIYALDKLGLPPESCLAIEDSRAGLLSATQAGLKTVVTRSHYTQQEDFREAVLVLDHLGEPDLPFQAIAGDPGSHTYVDLALAAELVARTH